MPEPYRVALLGFSAVERNALVAAFTAGRSHGPRFTILAAMLPMLDDADFLLADADDAPTVQLVVVTERVGDTLFIGSRPAPFGAAAWMPRPIDPQHVLRELDALINPLLGDGRIDPPLKRGEDAPGQTGTAAQAAQAAPVPFPQLDAWPGTAPAAPLPGGHSPRAQRALVVDDSDTARQFLRSRLEAWGLEVETAASSGQALSLLLRQHFDHLFIDVELGSGSKLDGLALCQLVRRKHISCGGAPDLVVIVSAHHGQLDRARGTLAGCDAYLGKPLDDADLRQLLRRQGLTPPATTDPPVRG